MVDVEEVEAEIRTHDDPVVTVPELADRVGASTTTVRQRLDALQLADRVEKKDVGARATAWWHVDRVVPPRVPPEDHPNQSGLDDVGEDTRHQEATDDVVPDQEDIDVELPDPSPAASNAAADIAQKWADDSRRETRQRAAAVALEWASMHGLARGDDAVDAIRAALPVDGQDRETYWRQNLRPALKKWGSYDAGSHAYLVESLE